MMKKLFAILLLLVAANAGAATTRYVKTSCTNAVTTFNPSTESCTTGSDVVYSSIANGIAAMASGDTLSIVSGTYSVGIDTNSNVIPAGGGESSRTIIKAKTTGGVTLNPSNQEILNIVQSYTSYITFDGLVIDGANCSSGASCDSLVSVGASGAHHIRFTNTEVKNAKCNLVSFHQDGSFLEFLNGSVHDSAVNVCAGVFASGSGYGFYVKGNDNLVEKTKIYNVAGYGIHNYHNPAVSASRNVYRYNDVSTTGQDTSVAFFAGILLGVGDSNRAYGNIIHDNVRAGIQVGNGATNSLVYNNTITRNGYDAGIVTNYHSGTIVRNNIIWESSIAAYDNQASISPTYSNNLCRTAGTGCAVVEATAGNIFVNAAGANFSLVTGTSAIDAGVASIATGVTACSNGSAPDLGAIESLPAPTATVNGSALTITATNNCTDSILPTSSVTGFSVKKNGSPDAITSLSRSGSNSFAGTLTNAFIGGDTCLFSYSQSSGNATANNAIGNAVTNNQEIFDFTDSSCTNITSGSGSVGLSHWRFYLLQGATDTAWTAKCAEDSANCVVAPGARIWARFKLRNNSGSDFPTFNYATRVRYNGGSYVTLGSSYTNGIKALGNGIQLGTVLNEGTTLTADQLTSNETNVSGVAVRDAISIPSLTLNNSTEVELAQAIDISTSASSGDTYEFCPYQDTGTALTCSTPAKIIVGSYSSVR